jgi:hypothetical protein
MMLLLNLDSQLMWKEIASPSKPFFDQLEEYHVKQGIPIIDRATMLYERVDVAYLLLWSRQNT